MTGQAPPHNLEAEMSVLGSVMLDNAVLPDVAAILPRPDFFYRAAHQAIWKAVLDLYGEGETVDAITVSDRLTTAGELTAVGGIDYLGEIIQSVQTVANAKYHAKIVKQKSVACRLAQSADDTLKDCYSNKHTADELLDRAAR